MALIATFIFFVGIVGLFVLDGDRRVRTSFALWLPVMWLLINGSRPISFWLNMTPASSPEQYLEGSPIDRAFYLTLLVVAIGVLAARSSRVTAFAKKNWPILLFVGYCALSVAWSDYSGVAFKRWIKSLGDYAMVLIVLTDREAKMAVKRVLARAGFILLPASVLVAKYYPDIGRQYASYEGTQFFTGIAQDKNMLGMGCLVFGLAASWRVIQEFAGARRMRILVVHGTVLGMAIWLLDKSNSMTSLACFLLANALMIAHATTRMARRRAVVHCLVFFTLAACFATLFLDVGGSVLESMGRNSTLTGRTDIWHNVLAVPINPVVGTGFESFWLGDRLEALWQLPATDRVNEAHNGFIETYLNLGWIGLFLIGTMIVFGYRNVLRSLRDDWEWGRLRLGFFVIGIAYNYSEAAIRTGDLVWIAFLMTIMAVPKPRAVQAATEAVERVGIDGTPDDELVPAPDEFHAYYASIR